MVSVDKSLEFLRTEDAALSGRFWRVGRRGPVQPRVRGTNVLAVPRTPSLGGQ